MTLLYRTIFTTEEPDPIAAARDRFQGWLREKGIAAELVESGSVEAGEWSLEVVQAARDGVSAVRVHLDEQQGHQRWSTTLTVMDGAEREAWVWVDVDRVSDRPYGPRPVIAAPRLVREFLESSTCRASSTVLHGRVRRCDEGEVEELARELLAPDRTVPIIVVSSDPTNPGAAFERGRKLFHALAGVANVWALEGRATSSLSRTLGETLHVYGGAVRTYHPGLTIDDEFPFRHRFAAREAFLPYPGLAAQRIARSILERATAARPPASLREQLARLPGFGREGRDGEQLLEDLLSVERERDQLQEDLQLSRLETEEAIREMEHARARVRWLEKCLSKHGDAVASDLMPPDPLDCTAESCEEALDLAAQLDRVEIGETVEHARELDRHQKGGAWGQKAWSALRALQSYAEAKATGAVEGDFLRFCTSPPPGSFPISAHWVALAESETTSKNRGFRQARTFPVPSEVDPSGKVYMGAHVKLEKGSDPAPRLHFYDDTGGRTGKVYVGYLGRHLPSPDTN